MRVLACAGKGNIAIVSQVDKRVESEIFRLVELLSVCIDAITPKDTTSGLRPGSSLSRPELAVEALVIPGSSGDRPLCDGDWDAVGFVRRCLGTDLTLEVLQRGLWLKTAGVSISHDGIKD